MSKKLFKQNTLQKSVAASAAGLIFSCAGAFAANGDQAQTTTNSAERSFPSVDQNNDQRLVWTEIRAVYEDELNEAGWEETQLMNEFDANEDQQIDAQEYVVFLSGLTNGPTTRQAAVNQQAVNGPDDQQQSQATGPQGQTENIVQNPDQTRAANVDIVQDDPSSLDRQSSVAANAATGSQNTNNTQAAQQSNNGGQQDSLSTTNSQQAMSGNSQQAMSGNSAIGQNQPAGANLTVEDVKQLPVRNMEGQELGQVEDVVMRIDGSEAGLVISVTGDSQEGASQDEAKKVFVGLDQLMATQDHVLWQTPLDGEQAQELPDYNKDLYVSIQ